MVFRAKIDSFFTFIMSFSILVIIGVFLIPLFLDKTRTMFDTVIVFSLLIISVGFIVWSVLSIKYVFYDDYLLVKGGAFRSRISYKDITKVSPTNDIFTGYRLLSSASGIEIFYKSGILGSVKISPKEKELFLSELKKRCPNAIIQESK
ncbi:PH domain-containing protein [Parageobacillus toebii]|uniref:PH domain-containing protein n=1 Tax=Parageobacillus toebii TaxID=153151 RepID=UPI000786E929|nr:PH domain-containing protein [Parageobacillus toebii]